jgi:hypothetical protein
MPPSRAWLKSKGWTDEKIDAAYEADRAQEEKIAVYLKNNKNPKMLDILEML